MLKIGLVERFSRFRGECPDFIFVLCSISSKVCYIISPASFLIFYYSFDARESFMIVEAKPIRMEDVCDVPLAFSP